MPEMTDERCRLVLILFCATEKVAERVAQAEAAFSGGDVASLLILQGESRAHEYADLVERITPIAQSEGIAVLIEDDSQLMGRAGADGIFTYSGVGDLKDTIARFSPKRIVGYGGVRTRHSAMEAAELVPDFLFLGKPDGDIRPEAHPKNIKLGAWCAEVMQIPVVSMGGSHLESVVEVAQSGVDFVALGRAVFGDGVDSKAAVESANALLDEHAPRFEDDDET